MFKTVGYISTLNIKYFHFYSYGEVKHAFKQFLGGEASEAPPHGSLNMAIRVKV